MLFDYLKKQKHQKTVQEEALEGLVKFNMDNGDLATAFYFANKATVDFWDNEFWSRWNRANKLEDPTAKIQGMQTAESCLTEFRKWCTQHEGGVLYYKEYWTKFDEMVKNSIQQTRYRAFELPGEITRRAGDGIAQADLIRSFDPSQKFIVQEVIDRLASEGKLQKEKRSNRWFISVP